MKDILYDTDNNNIILYVEDSIVLDSSGEFYVTTEFGTQKIINIPYSPSYQVVSMNSSDLPNDLRPGKYIYDESPNDFWINQDWEGFVGVNECKKRVRAEIVEYREKFIESGVIFGGYEFYTRPRDRENLIGTITAIIGILVSGQEPTTFPWSLKNGMVIVLTHGELLEIGVALLRFINDAFIATRYHIIEMEKLDNCFDVKNYDYKSTIWPDRDLGGTLQNTPIQI